MRFPLILLSLLLATHAITPAFAQEGGQDAPAVASSDDPDAAETAPSKVPLDEIRRYVAVFNAVKDAYVEPVDDKKLMHSAIRGLLLDLDPHSTYFDREDAEAFDEQATGAYDGVGVELLQQPDNTLRVIAPIDDTPAARAGIKAGDVIVAINGKPITAEDGMERFACPTPDRMGRYRCIDDHVLCDGFIDCPNGEDEDRQACMFYKTVSSICHYLPFAYTHTLVNLSSPDPIAHPSLLLYYAPRKWLFGLPLTPA